MIMFVMKQTNYIRDYDVNNVRTDDRLNNVVESGSGICIRDDHNW